MLDRIDIHMHIPNINILNINKHRLPEDTATIKERINMAYQMQCKRFQGLQIKSNAEADYEYFKRNSELNN